MSVVRKDYSHHVLKRRKSVISTEDVITGLKCCVSEPFEKCDECPFLNSGKRCYEALMSAALKRIEIQANVIGKLEEIINEKERC